MLPRSIGRLLAAALMAVAPHALAQGTGEPLTPAQARLIEINAYLLVAAQTCGYEMRVGFLRRVYRDAGLNG